MSHAWLYVAVGLAACVPNYTPHCPTNPYTPRGAAITAVSECPADACPLRCGDGKVCTRDDALTCEACADLLTYMAEDCEYCFLNPDGGVFAFDCWE